MDKEEIQKNREKVRLKYKLPPVGTPIYKMFGLNVWLDKNNKEKVFCDDTIQNYREALKLIK